MRMIKYLGKIFTQAGGANNPKQVIDYAGGGHAFDLQNHLGVHPLPGFLGGVGTSLKDQLDRIDAEKAALMARIAMDDLRRQFDVLHLPVGWGLVLADTLGPLPSVPPSYALVRLVFKDIHYELVVFVDQSAPYAGLFDTHRQARHSYKNVFVPTVQNAVVCAQSKVDLLMLMIAMNSQEGPTNA